MTAMASTKDGTILKTDVLGRVKTPPTRREQLLDEFDRGGLSGAKFAELAGIKYQTFAGRVGCSGGTNNGMPLRRWLRRGLGNCAYTLSRSTPGSSSVMDATAPLCWPDMKATAVYGQ